MINFDINTAEVLASTVLIDDEIKSTIIPPPKKELDKPKRLDLLKYIENKCKELNDVDYNGFVTPNSITRFFHQNCPEIHFEYGNVTEDFFEHSTVYKLPNNKYVKVLRCHEFNSNNSVTEDFYKYIKRNRYVEVIPVNLVENVFEESYEYVPKMDLIAHLTNCVMRRNHIQESEVTDHMLKDELFSSTFIINNNIVVNTENIYYETIFEIEQDIFIKVNREVKYCKDTNKMVEDIISRIRDGYYIEVVAKEKIVLSFKEI